MRRSLLALVLLAGCASSPQATAPGAQATCPEIDGVAFGCAGATLPALQVMDQAPPLTEGWLCTIDHDDEAPREFFKLYSHTDGRLGYHWRWPLPEWSHRFVALTLAEPGRTSWGITEYVPEGFAEFPAARQGDEGEAAISVIALRLDERVDGQWRPIEGARLDVGIADGAGYYVWSWADGDEVVRFDITAPHDERVWDPEPRIEEVNGRLVSAAVKGSSSSFGAMYWGPERVVGWDCADDGLPGVA